MTTTSGLASGGTAAGIGVPMSLSVQLLGRPADRADLRGDLPVPQPEELGPAGLPGAGGPAARAAASWRQLLFSDADDPHRALRWNLSELRRGLGRERVGRGRPRPAAPPARRGHRRRRPGSRRLERRHRLPGWVPPCWTGMTFRTQRGIRDLVAGRSSVTYRRFRGDPPRSRRPVAGARRLAGGDRLCGRVTAMSPLDENHQALLIRLYRLAGDDDAAEHSSLPVPRCSRASSARSRGGRAGRPPDHQTDPLAEADDATIEAVIEAGSAAMGAGALEAGIRSLQTATRLADAARKTRFGCGHGSSSPRPWSTPSAGSTRRVWPASTKPTRSPSPTS